VPYRNSLGIITVPHSNFNWNFNYSKMQMDLSKTLKNSRLLYLVTEFNKKILMHPLYFEKKNGMATSVIFYDDDLTEFYPLMPSPEGWGIISEDLVKTLQGSNGESEIKQFKRKDAKNQVNNDTFLRNAKSEIDTLLQKMVEEYLEKYAYFLEFFQLDNHDIVQRNFKKIVEEYENNPIILLSQQDIIGAIEKQLKNTHQEEKNEENDKISAKDDFSLAKELQILKDNGKHTVSEICSSFKICKTKYYDLLRKLKSGWLGTSENRQVPEVKTYLKGAELMLFKKMADDPNKSYTGKEMQNALYEKFGTEISVGNIYYHLHHTFDYSYKRNHYKPPNAFTPEQKVLDFLVSKELLEFAAKSLEIIAIDETSIGLACNIEHSFSKRGKPPYRVGYTKCESLNLTMAISCNKIYCYQIRKDTNNELTFIAFLLELMKKIMSSEPKYYSEVCILMDNVKFHKSINVLNMLSLFPIKVCFSSPTNSNLNPIENCFGMIKHELKSKKNTSMYIFQDFITKTAQSY